MSPSGREIHVTLLLAFDSDISAATMLPLGVGQDINWDMAPNPLYPQSSISRAALDDLAFRLGRQPTQVDDRTFLLEDLRISSVPVPDLVVRVSSAAARLRGDGILGFDFFSQFEVVTWYPRRSRMSLILPDE